MNKSAPTNSKPMSISATWCLIVLLIVCGWISMIMQVMAMDDVGALHEAGPAMFLFDWFKLHILGDHFAYVTSENFCIRTDGLWSIVDFFKAFAMWISMVFAMMLPRFLMVRNLFVGGRNEQFHFCLLAGYLSAWTLFCLVGVSLQWILTRNGMITPFMVVSNEAVNILLGVAIAVVCLLKQFGSEAEIPGSVNEIRSGRMNEAVCTGFSLGMRCVGNCWLLMCATFALGLMNLVAMLILTCVMVLTATKFARRTYKAVGLAATLAAISVPVLS